MTRAEICLRACEGLSDDLLSDPNYSIKAELDNLDEQIAARLKIEAVLRKAKSELSKLTDALAKDILAMIKPYQEKPFEVTKDIVLTVSDHTASDDATLKVTTC